MLLKRKFFVRHIHLWKLFTRQALYRGVSSRDQNNVLTGSRRLYEQVTR